ncbi:MAG: cell division protein FtsA, partial [Lachnospiraceae bacterium]|nr:cell division protein FtsA [Lachnospiraceae bacterium]
FLQKDINVDSLLVTPIGICLNYYEQKNNFIFVQVNGERVKLYDNSRLTIVDAALAIGFPNDGLFPKRGKPLEFYLNGKKRLVRGEEGEPARILLNGRPAGINTTIAANDVIEITPSTAGAAAQLEVGGLAEYRSTIEFIVNGKKVICPKFVRANRELVSEYYDIKERDELEMLNYYTLRQLLDFMDVTYKEGILVNRMPAGQEEKVYEKFRVDYDFGESSSWGALEKMEAVQTADKEPDFPEETAFPEDGTAPEDKAAPDDDAAGQNSADTAQAPKEEPVSIRVMVNGEPVVLSGKSKYIVVDILDFYNFDVKTAKGNRVVLRVNGGDADFSTPVTKGDFVEMYWEG